MSWTIKEQVPTLYVSDLELAVEYYGRLGFEVQWQWPKSEASHIGLRNGSCAVMLIRGKSFGQGEVYFVVDDVNVCFESIHSARPWDLVLDSVASHGDRTLYHEASLEAPPEPTVKDHKHRDFLIVDPWGHRLSFGCEEVR